MQGARQTGITWLLKYFGSNFYESVSYFNFKKQTELGQFFETNKNPERIIENLSLVDGKPILPGGDAQKFIKASLSWPDPGGISYVPFPKCSRNWLSMTKISF